MGSAGSRDGIPPPSGIAQGPGGQGAPGLVVNLVEGPRPGLGDRGIPGEGAHPGRIGEGALRQGHHPGEGQRPGPGDQGWQDDGGTYGQVRPLTLWPVDEHGPDQEQRGNGSAGRGRRPEGVAGGTGGWQWVPPPAEAQWQGWDNRGGNGEPLQQPPQVNPFWSPEVQRRAIAAGMPVAEGQGGFVGSPQRPEPGSQGRSQQAVDVEGLRRRIMKEAEEAFQLELNRLNQAGGSYSDEASFRTAQSDPIPPPPPPPPPPRRTAANMTEALRNLELPALPFLGGDMASLQFGDWVTVINPLMSDIAGSARTWWRKVVEQAEQAYARWLVATPLEKIRLLPELDLGPEHNFRVEQRGVSMLLAAVPDGIRRDIISSRNVIDQRDVPPVPDLPTRWPIGAWDPSKEPGGPQDWNVQCGGAANAEAVEEMVEQSGGAGSGAARWPGSHGGAQQGRRGHQQRQRPGWLQDCIGQTGIDG